MLFETRPYSEMTPEQRGHAKSYRSSSYRSDRKEKGRGASGSNEANKRSTAKWRRAHPGMYKAHNKVSSKVRTGDLSPVKPGKARHHTSTSKFKEVSVDTNARKANEKRAGS